MDILKKLGKFLFILAVLGAVLFVLQAAPSILWPERSASLVKDEGYQGGHQSLGINERAVEKDAQTLLFSELKKWRFDKDRPASPPEEVTAFDNRRVRITGFMYPLEPGSMIRLFCLLRSTQTCCYGPRPQYNQYVLVEMERPVRFERLSPVQVEGTFFVEPRPEDGYIYRMRGVSAARAGAG